MSRPGARAMRARRSGQGETPSPRGPVLAERPRRPRPHLRGRLGTWAILGTICACRTHESCPRCSVVRGTR